MALVPGNDNSDHSGFIVPANDIEAGVGADDERLVKLAARLIAFDRQREILFGEIGPDPGWRLLLTLFVHEHDGDGLPLDELAGLCGHRSTVIERTAQVLEQGGKIALAPDMLGERRHVRLTADGRDVLAGFLRGLGLRAAGSTRLDRS